MKGMIKMKFKELDKRKVSQVETDILKSWGSINEITYKQINSKDIKNNFVFYDGPAFANGFPGLHHMVSKNLKDAITKYHVMKGERIVKKIGWDTHGLPIENHVEKKLGISSKKEIEKLGVEKFNGECRKSVRENEDAFNSALDYKDIKTPIQSTATTTQKESTTEQPINTHQERKPVDMTLSRQMKQEWTPQILNSRIIRVTQIFKDIVTKLENDVDQKYYPFNISMKQSNNLSDNMLIQFQDKFTRLNGLMKKFKYEEDENDNEEINGTKEENSSSFIKEFNNENIIKSVELQENIANSILTSSYYTLRLS